MLFRSRSPFRGCECHQKIAQFITHDWGNLSLCKDAFASTSATFSDLPLEAHGEVQDLFFLRVIHDASRLRILLDRNVLLAGTSRWPRTPPVKMESYGQMCVPPATGRTLAHDTDRTSFE